MPVPNAGLLPTQMWGQPPAPMTGQMSALMAAQMSPQIGGNMPAQIAAQLLAHARRAREGDLVDAGVRAQVAARAPRELDLFYVLYTSRGLFKARPLYFTPRGLLYDHLPSLLACSQS